MEKNYITPQGLQKLQEEFRELKSVERPQIVETVAWAAANGDRSENADYQYGKRRLRQIDKRLEFLTKRLDICEVIDPSTIKSDRVLFGATVTIEDEDGEEKIYKIVGVDEIDTDSGLISWRSPLGKALFKAKVGDYVTFQTPGGEREVEILKINYI
ncbi:MAG: transcription elongation factor GreB [Deltaproteobacteria bacterium]|nr:transcription elongation factor GreB [Deltaproteobacteria bacterium]